MVSGDARTFYQQSCVDAGFKALGCGHDYRYDSPYVDQCRAGPMCEPAPDSWGCTYDRALLAATGWCDIVFLVSPTYDGAPPLKVFGMFTEADGTCGNLDSDDLLEASVSSRGRDVYITCVALH